MPALPTDREPSPARSGQRRSTELKGLPQPAQTRRRCEPGTARALSPPVTKPAHRRTTRAQIRRSQRRLRPGITAAGPTTSARTAVPVPKPGNARALRLDTEACNAVKYLQALSIRPDEATPASRRRGYTPIHLPRSAVGLPSRRGRFRPRSSSGASAPRALPRRGAA